MLDVATEKSASMVRIDLNGKLDAASAIDFQKFFQDLFEKGNRYFLLDFSHLEYVSSSGISSLVTLSRKLEVSGAACILHANQEIKLVLEFFHLDKKIPFVASEIAAEEYLSGEASRKKGSLNLESRASSKTSTIQSENVNHSLRELADQLSRLGKTMDKFTANNQLDFASKKPSLEPPVTQMKSASSLTGTLDIAGDTVLEIQPTIIECEQCGENLRIRSTGMHACPNCKIRFSVKGDASASFFEKL